jgi:antitoxin component YwqK of YwqJK toxin-antitoxin module
VGTEKISALSGLLDGKVIEYYDNNKIKSISYYSENILIDSSIHYNLSSQIEMIRYYNNSDSIYLKNFEDEKFISDGYYFNNKKILNYYNINGQINKKYEYIDSCGVQYTNQGWLFDKNNNIIKDKGNNYKI